ncbi:MAG: hypothetical protein EAX95_14445 [Candidatus Thorarchaeota archaeon]|nr:hypothetical protein [Candidatus Thorarchaeota archaeon]
MQRVRKKEQILSRLVPKNHFCSMSLFREDPLVRWNYTESVLFTAYDIFRSSDFWLDSVISSGSTLKEAMIQLGFPKETKMLADTGVFEFEARKAGLATELGIDIELELSISQILEAYQLSGADYFVAPDEIILPIDTRLQVRRKIAKIKSNLESVMEHIKANRIIAVLQGCDKQTIDTLFDYFVGNGISLFARGGLIPLWKHDSGLFNRIVKYTRKLTKDYWLHTFGLPRVGLISYYLHDVGMDSVDSSTLSYITARRKYLLGADVRPVRLADFSSCDCVGCERLQQKPKPQSPEFFVGLYLHNVLEASKVSSEESGETAFSKWRERPHEAELRGSVQSESAQMKQKADSWGTAYERYRRQKGET